MPKHNKVLVVVIVVVHVQKKLGPKHFAKKNFWLKNLDQKCLVKKIFGEILGTKKFGPKKYLGLKKVNQNKMLDHNNKTPQKLGSKTLVDIGSAEILLKKLVPKV